MRVYRIEDGLGWGYYRSIHYSRARVNGFTCTRRPGPLDDGLPAIEGYRFGFDSLEKLKRWFGIGMLRKETKFFLVTYEVSDVIMGKSKKQLIFRIKQSEEIKRLRLDKTLKL